MVILKILFTFGQVGDDGTHSNSTDFMLVRGTNKQYNERDVEHFTSPRGDYHISRLFKPQRIRGSVRNELVECVGFDR